MDERMDPSTGCLAHAHSQRIDGGGVCEVRSERRGTKTRREQGIRAGARLLLLSIDEEHTGSSFGECASDGLSDLTFASHAGEHDASTR
jgi:hypothetical protein